jgi:hypothetical protein
MMNPQAARTMKRRTSKLPFVSPRQYCPIWEVFRGSEALNASVAWHRQTSARSPPTSRTFRVPACARFSSLAALPLLASTATESFQHLRRVHGASAKHRL